MAHLSQWFPVQSLLTLICNRYASEVDFRRLSGRVLFQFFPIFFLLTALIDVIIVRIKAEDIGSEYNI